MSDELGITHGANHSHVQREARQEEKRQAWLENVGAPVLLALMLTAILVWLLLPSTPPDALASGADAGSYLLTTQYVVDTFQETGTLPTINPEWYAGFAVFHNTPLLVYLVLAPIYALTGNLVTTSHLAHMLFALSVGLAGFVALRRRFSNLAAVFGGFLLATVPVVLDQTIYGGSYPRTLGVALCALAFPFVEGFVTEGPRARYVAPGALILALGLIAHPPTGAASVVIWSIYVVLRSRSAGTISFKRAFSWAFLLAIAGGLTAWYLLPFFAESQGWTSFPDIVYEGYSVPVSDSIRWLGWSHWVLALLGIWFGRKDRALGAVMLTGAISLVLAGGVYTVIPTIIPGMKSIYPFVFLFGSAFAITYAATHTVEALGRREVRVVGLLAIVVGASLFYAGWFTRSMASYGSQVASNYQAPEDIATAEFVRDHPTEGRLMIMKYPFSYLPWWTMSMSDKPGIEGWYYSLTPTGKHIAWAYEAIDHGFPEYSADVFDRWNVRLLVANANFTLGGEPYEDFTAILEDRGFSVGHRNEANRVYEREDASTFAMPVEARTLVVGRRASHPAAIIEDAIIAGSPNLADLSPEYLASFDTLVLAGFAYDDRAEAEELVSDFARNGGTVVVSLGGMATTMIEENPRFLDVTGIQTIVEDEVRLDVHDLPDSLPRLPETLVVPKEPPVPGDETLTEWRYLSYMGLDTSYADDTVTPMQSVLGTKDVGGADVWFVGGGLFYHAFRTGDASEVALVRALAEHPGPSNAPPAPHIEEIDPGPEGVVLSVDAEETAPVLVSWAYSGHWKAEIDGEPVPTYNLDDLIAVMVPAGEHEVTIEYGSIWIHPVANAITLLTLALIGWLFVREHRRGSEPQMEAEAA